jgi:hypothetical protein
MNARKCSNPYPGLKSILDGKAESGHELRIAWGIMEYQRKTTKSAPPRVWECPGIARGVLEYHIKNTPIDAAPGSGKPCGQESITEV